jgi:hypothetical protein
MLNLCEFDEWILATRRMAKTYSSNSRYSGMHWSQDGVQGFHSCMGALPTVSHKSKGERPLRRRSPLISGQVYDNFRTSLLSKCDVILER